MTPSTAEHHVDPDRAELDLWMVLHEPTGPAAEWAGRARPGDPVAVWGPREAFTPPDGTTDFLIVADHQHRQPLPQRDGVSVRWLYRDGAPDEAGTLRLVEAVRRHAPEPGTAYAWGGGESRSMNAVRRLLRHERDWPNEAVSMVAYWRRGGRDG